MIQLSGVQFFPVTPFGVDGALDADVLAEHIESRLEFGPGAVFAACGTGEFHALSPAEHARVTEVAVAVAAGRCPVFVGAGGPVGCAVEMARAAADRGASGLLLMPPYLQEASPAGVLGYATAVAKASDLPLIVYNRKEFRLDPGSAAELADLPTVIGFKDGLGDMDLLTSIRVEVSRAAVRSARIQYFNGLPTAETSAQAYRAIGVQTYSSAVFGFVPQVSLAFHAALTTGDQDVVDRLLANFFVPFAALRRSIAGGAISVVKLGVRLAGTRVGGVRPPLVDPPSRIADELAAVIDAGLSCLPART